MDYVHYHGKKPPSGKRLHSPRYAKRIFSPTKSQEAKEKEIQRAAAEFGALFAEERAEERRKTLLN
jgi:hypothetical protein